jgi:alpha-galactosidase
MMRKNLFFMALVVGLVQDAQAAKPSAVEMDRRAQWLDRSFIGDTPQVPFSLNVVGKSVSAAALRHWRLERPPTAGPEAREQHTIVFTDPATGLRLRCVVVSPAQLPVIEWTLFIENGGAAETPLLEDIRPLDVLVPAPSGRHTLHYAKGATCSMDDFEPMTLAMEPEAKLRLQPGGGRSSSEFLPFFNLESEPQGGIVLGLGWSGEWAAEFEAARPEGARPTGTHARAGMALTHLKLRPGEVIRTPSVAMLFYEGGWIHGQNLWRRFVLDRHRPTVNGKPLEPLILAGNWGGTRAADHLANIEAIATNNIPVDYYWIDAEWFGTGPWFLNAGDWRVKRDLYPQGFKPISDAVHRSGRRLLLWFEPERVCEETPWATELQKWLLEVPKDRRCYRWGDKQSFPDWVVAESRRNQIKEGDRLFNLALPEARAFLAEFVAARIAEFGLDCYRHDANIAPLEFWRAADSVDRQGMTEIRWVEGLYAFWDELLRRNPNLIIDNCASGGRRIDLETLSRSTPFWRTDFPGDVTARQCHTYGISFWVPLNSTGGVTPGRDGDYALRSTFSSCIVVNLFGNGDAPQAAPPPADAPFARIKAALEEYRGLQKYFLGDYYPLLPYSKAADAWVAWQFHRDDLGEGMVQAFRRPQAASPSIRVRLCDLDAAARYSFATVDAPQTSEQASGAELMESGVTVTAANAPAAIILTYRKVSASGTSP